MSLHRFLRNSVLAVVLGFLAGLAHGQGYQLKPEYFRASDFKLQSGAMLKEVVVEYATLGEPQRDAAGNIINAVINPHGWSGNYAQTVGLAKDMVGPGRPLDPDKYFIIFPTAMGSPGSSSPSAYGLGPKFPEYTVADMVNAQRHRSCIPGQRGARDERRGRDLFFLSGEQDGPRERPA